MTDRELLELAAKAAGIDWFDEPAAKSGRGLHLKSGPFWNPLDDDGDALRLAVKLFLHVLVDDGFSEAMCDWKNVIEAHDGNPYAATRRAIVKAAANVGKEMK